MFEGKSLLFSPRTHDLKEFEQLAASAKDAGFTHVFISDLSERTPFQGEEKDSPWTEWAAILPCVFKHALPPGMEDAFPAAWVKRQMEFMKAKHRIVKKLGLKAAYYGTEPHWLNDKVYRKHPQWRGSRADNCLRTTGMYFAPNTDHPEVRKAYGLAIQEILRQCPLIEFFTFNTNDSGALYPWEKRAYSGVNGPTGYENRDMGNRVADFLMAMRQSAAATGSDAKFFTNVYNWFVDDEVHLILRSMKPGIGVNGRCPGEHEAECSLLGCGGWGGGIWMPAPVIDQYPAPFSVLGAAAAVRTAKARQFNAGGNCPEFFRAFKTACRLPPASTEYQKMTVLRAIAADLYGDEVTDDVVDAWHILQRADIMAGMSHMDAMGGPVTMRWMTRPLVAHQELLSEDEKAYWLPYVYQSRNCHPDAWMDYLNRSGYRIANNWDEASRLCCILDSVEGTLAAAAAKLKNASDKADDSDAKELLLADSYRVRASRSLFLTIRHYLQVGTLIYLRDEENQRMPKRTATDELMRPSMPKGNFGSQGLWFLNRALRWELDNVTELIDLMKQSPVPLFYTARHPSFAGSLILEPNLLEHLERKVDIMLKYWRTAEQGYYRPTYGG